MNTKTNLSFPKSGMKQQVSPSNLQKVSLTISQFLDIMSDPCYKEEYFLQMLTRKPDEMSVLAENDNMEVLFSIRLKGGAE